MNCKDFFDLLYIAASAIIICLQIITTYVGFVAFLYLSIQIIFSYPLSIISNCLSRNWFAFVSNLFWLFDSIPYFHIMVVINIKIIMSFFKNIWKALDLKKTENRLRQFIQNPVCCDKKFRVDRWGFFYLFAVLLNFIFLIIEVTTTDDQTVCSLAFAGLSCYPPIVSVIIVFIRCIPITKRYEQIGIINTNDDSTQKQNSESTDDKQSSEINLEEEESEEKGDQNEIKKWQLYFDPSQIIIQNEINDFIKDDNVNDYKYINYNHKIIPSFFITAIFIEYIVYFTYYFVDIGKNRDYFDIAIFVFRIIYSFLSYRFLITFNAINFIKNFSKIKEKHNFIWLTYLVSLGISILILVVVGIGMIIIYCIFKPFKLNDFQYSPVYENVTFGQQSSICQMKFYDFDIIEYAGIAALGQSKNEAIATEILKMLFDNQVFPIITNDNPISHIYTIQINESLHLRAFESLNDRNGFSFMLDLFINDFVFNRLSYGIIPFYHVTVDIFLYRYLYFLSMVLNRYLLMDLVRQFAYFANTLYKVYDQVHFKNATIIYVGHSIGGLIAKGIGTKRNVPSIAFESLNYYHSMFHMSINLDSTFDFKSEKLKIMNVYSPSQIFSESEKSATVNLVLPKWKDMYQFINAYDTFCVIAAGCATDARYDKFCNAVIGKNNFLNLFKLWNRSRSDLG